MIPIFSLSLNQSTSVAGPPVDVHVMVCVLLSYSTDMSVICPVCLSVHDNICVTL